MSDKPNKAERLTIRLSTADRRLIERSARGKRRLSEWCRMVLVGAARKGRRRAAA